MQTTRNRTGIGHTDQDFLDVFWQTGGQYDVDMAADFGNSAWIRSHVFGGVGRDFRDFKSFGLGINAEGGDDASG